MLKGTDYATQDYFEKQQMWEKLGKERSYPF